MFDTWKRTEQSDVVASGYKGFAKGSKRHGVTLGATHCNHQDGSWFRLTRYC